MTLKKDGSDEIQIIKGPSELNILQSLFRPDCDIPEVTRFQAEFASGCHFETEKPVDVLFVAVIDGASRHPTTNRSTWKLTGHFNEHIARKSYNFTATYDVVRRTGTMKIEMDWWMDQRHTLP